MNFDIFDIVKNNQENLGSGDLAVNPKIHSIYDIRNLCSLVVLEVV